MPRWDGGVTAFFWTVAIVLGLAIAAAVLFFILWLAK